MSKKKTGIKQCRKRRGKIKDDKNKNQFDKRREDNKTLSPNFFLTEDNKKEGTEDQDSGT
jgi:hypothetical protein